MFLERKEKEEKQNGQRYVQGAVAGYDLGHDTAQISYCLSPSENPETVSQIAGDEDYLIPAMLAKRTDRELWLYGREAQECVLKGEAEPVTGLLEKAAAGRAVEVAQEAYDPIALLTLFLKRTLSLLVPVIPINRLQAFVFSVEEVTAPVLEALRQAAAQLGLSVERIYVIGRAESFFYYNICQPQELWAQDVMVCDFSGQMLKTLLFTRNRRTTPVACFVEEKQKEQLKRFPDTEDETERIRNGMKLDERFYEVLQEELADRQVSSVYLIGTGFDGDWYQKSRQILCRDRRVFRGNNLYSKGACYAGRERLKKGGISGEYAFLGKDMLKANLGMHVVRRGADAYLALLDAGTNWYEAQKECEFLLEEKNTFSLRITPLNGREVREVQVTLGGLAQRPAYTTRIRMKVDMTDVKTVRISMEDLGFGEFFPATHKFWEETFLL